MNSDLDVADTVLAGLPAGPLCVALSGGLDSMVLLHVLARHARDRPLRALHVHHGISAQADDWVAHCERWCREWAVPLDVQRVHAQPRGDGLEAALRDARYAAFEAALAPGEALVLAHHLDDQAETFLLRALRASGVDGLAAMPRTRGLGAGTLVRPLLDIERARLHAYAIEHGLAWVEDPGNADTVHDRNFLRQHVVPLLRERWPHAAAALARSASLARDESDLLKRADAHALASAATLDAATLRRDVIAALPPARRARVLRHWTRTLGLPPMPAQALAQAEAVLTARDDANPCVAWSGVALRAWRGLLHLAPVRAPLPSTWRAAWDGAAPLAVPTGTWSLEGASRLPAAAHAFARQGGERIVLPGRLHSHTLKHVLQDLGVPPWERERLPLLADAAGTLLAAGDLVYSDAFDGWLRENGARLRWQPHADR